MNISPTEVDNNSSAFSHLSGEVMGRMQSESSFMTGVGTMPDMKNANGLSTKSVPSKSLSLLKKASSKGEKPDEVNKGTTAEPSKSKTTLEGKPDVKKKRSRKKWKKPKDKPNRPLSAYNLFFQAERASMLGNETPNVEDKKKRVHRKTHGKVGFAEMARVIGSKWKNLPPEQKKGFEERAATEKKRYAVELATWEEQKKREKTMKQLEERKEKSCQNNTTSNPACNAASKISQPVQMAKETVSNVIHSTNDRQQELPSMDYLRMLQERQAERAALLSRSNLDPSLFQYPSAAEASANAILQQFQGSQQGQPSQLFDTTGRFGGFPSPEFAQMASSQRALPLDFERLQQLRLQSAMDMSQGAVRDLGASADLERIQQMRLRQALNMPERADPSQTSNTPFGSAPMDLSRLPLAQYPPGSLEAAMRRFRYNM